MSVLATIRSKVTTGTTGSSIGRSTLPGVSTDGAEELASEATSTASSPPPAHEVRNTENMIRSIKFLI
ncbi:hypothetical protein [Halobacteriovorax sp.]|uniref:hypothetical protein n=1 Tax=Halobacteriovorax sp. TaxID=2020862 RepID=UPI003569F8AE